MSEAPPEGWEAAKTGQEIATIVEEAMSAGALYYDSPENPDRWKALVKLFVGKLFLAARPAPGVEGDWVLVPKVPTRAMFSAMVDAYDDGDEGSTTNTINAIYRALIAAAPPPPGES